MAITWESLWSEPVQKPEPTERRRATRAIARNSAFLVGPILLYSIAFYWIWPDWLDAHASKLAQRILLAAYAAVVAIASIQLARKNRKVDIQFRLSPTSLFAMAIVAGLICQSTIYPRFDWQHLTLLLVIQAMVYSVAIAAFYHAYLLDSLESMGLDWRWCVVGSAATFAVTWFPRSVDELAGAIWIGFLVAALYSARRNFTEVAGIWFILLILSAIQERI
jgi:hypothetical protein